MCGPEPCKSPTPCGRCERGAARLAATEAAAPSRADHVGSLEVVSRREERIARVLRVISATSD